jgi:hypothetical protein
MPTKFVGGRLEDFGDARPTPPSDITVKITPDQREKIAARAKQRGVSFEDEVGRIFRFGLRTVRPVDGGAQ